MEDGSNGLSSDTSNTQTLSNGEVMAKLSESVAADVNETRPESPPKVNGNSNADENTVEEEYDSSDCDALVIDESVKSCKTKKNDSRSKYGGFKGFKKESNDSFVHSNPYFSESIFDLLEKSQEKKQEHLVDQTFSDKKTNCKNNLKSSDKKVKSNPKLREYAQYLGLQPTVQFKCSKCSRAGFQSLQSLNEHVIQCDDSTPVNNLLNNTTPNAPSTNIRVTRKVFLCSACGTYYENWNLFLHMREVHKRYICLYCLGMFSHPDKLSLHIVSKHNCVPSRINSVEEFYNLHKEPCFLMCCECQKGFTERDNFFDHSCIESSLYSGKASNNKQAKATKQKNIEHVTADSAENVSMSIVEANEENNDTTKVNNQVEENETCANENKEMKTVAEESILASDNQEVKEKLNEVDSENNLLTSKLTDTELGDNQKSVETLICDNNETDDINEISNLSEESTRKRTESNSEDEITRQDDSLYQEQANSDDLNDSLDMSAEDPETETAQDSNTMQDREDQSDVYVDMDTRRVPKVTLKLPKSFDYEKNENEEGLPYESDDSENLTMEVDQIENESENVPVEEGEEVPKISNTENQLQIAGPDVPIIELELEQPLDKFDIRILLQKCLRTTISTCIYCNHARRISVNGKQLGLHAIAEHRFSAVVNSITAEELIPESFVVRIKDGLPELENVYFNLETNLPDEAITFSHVFECFQCRYSTTVHKELYLHNRKMHAKSILLCIMCKSNFYSYSELICHLCPGVYELEKDVQFRCCMCVSDDLPSAFRLMVHLRKKHHACDVCLELCHNQSKLSNHVWKHKLHHLCYRCGIAYRNKPDITKHLYWKHGTESVTCKKCLQKKWPHVYHFCILPLNFTCEECNLSFSRAVSLMVHKRFHTDDKPHTCKEEGCEEKFVSKKLLLKHEFKHREPAEEAANVEPENTQELENTQIPPGDTQIPTDENTPPCENEEKVEKPKPKVDVYDLPELNLSESDSSESEDEKAPKTSNDTSNDKPDDQDGENSKNKDLTEIEKPPPVMETIWDDFRNYQANKEKEEQKNKQDDYTPLLEIIMNDHDYCVVSKPEEEKPESTNIKLEDPESVQMSVDHDYCFGQKENSKDSKEKSPKKRTSSSSGSSSDSNSSSCTCGSNCSCSSSSGSSSSSSDSSESDSSSSEGRRRQQARRERRKRKLKNKSKENETVDVVATDNQPVIPLDVPVQESDLETTESDTDEDFYDKQPQKLANKLLAEKKNQLLQMAAIGPYINGSIMDGSRPPTPNLPEETKPKKKSKNKKRKKKSRNSKHQSENRTDDIPKSYLPMAPLTLTLPKNSPVVTPQFNSPNRSPMTIVPLVAASPTTTAENDNSLRASKRRRVPNKFYGYSSDEEQDKIPQPPVLKWRKVDLPSPRSPMIVPPLTIKTVPPQAPPLETMLGRGTSGESRMPHARVHQQMRPPIVPKIRPPLPQDQESGTDSNDSSSDEDQPIPAPPPTKEQPALYCYCRCPYDEVSEMIGCDATDCAIEWFHFECVGIMVPPKGQWFCPDCRKKKQQRREALQNQL